MKIDFLCSRFVAILSFALNLVSCGGGGGASAPPLIVDKTRPNIIVIFTDDQGYADLGVQDQYSDLKTPNIDMLAADGVRFTQGYVTAPQCSPSRAAMVTGQYQQRFGVDENHFTPMPLEVTTIGTRFQQLGYKTGMVGKWNLEVDGNSKEWAEKNVPANVPYDVGKVSMETKKPFFPDNRGYDDTYFGFNKRYWSNFDLKGNDRKASYIDDNDYRIDVISDAAMAFIERNKQHPFYLHVAHFGPHVPIEATEEYLGRFAQDMPLRRRYALATMAAIDDGVGKIVDTLEQNNLLENTVLFFVSDNGAPLGEDLTDAPITDMREAWNGSLNTPMIGEKGMLTDGGLRVPFIVQWQGTLPAGLVIDNPVSSLDVGVTALKIAGYTKFEQLDGVDLLPAIKGDKDYLDIRPLFWRFDKQRAIRLGQWKYLQAGTNREYLFDMSDEISETVNLINEYPDIAESLRESYLQWSSQMIRPDEFVELDPAMKNRFDFYLTPQ